MRKMKWPITSKFRIQTKRKPQTNCHSCLVFLCTWWAFCHSIITFWKYFKAFTEVLIIYQKFLKVLVESQAAKIIFIFFWNFIRKARIKVCVKWIFSLILSSLHSKHYLRKFIVSRHNTSNASTILFDWLLH